MDLATAPLSAILARRMVALRAHRGWSQRRLSDELQHSTERTLHPTSIVEIEKCRRRVSIEEAEDIAQVFGVGLCDLLSRAPMTISVPIE